MDRILKFNDTKSDSFVVIGTTFHEQMSRRELGNILADIEDGVEVEFHITREIAMKIAAHCNVVKAKEGDTAFAAFLNTTSDQIADERVVGVDELTGEPLYACEHLSDRHPFDDDHEHHVARMADEGNPHHD